MKLYVAVSKDKYELPVCVCDTATELAKKMGTSADVIYSSIYHKKGRYRKVIIEDKKE